MSSEDGWPSTDADFRTIASAREMLGLLRTVTQELADVIVSEFCGPRCGYGPCKHIPASVLEARRLLSSIDGTAIPPREETPG